MAKTKLYAAHRIEPAFKNGKPNHKKGEKLYTSVLTDDQAKVLNSQAANTKIYYYEVADNGKKSDAPDGKKSDDDAQK